MVFNFFFKFPMEIWEKWKIESVISQPGPKVWMTFFLASQWYELNEWRFTLHTDELLCDKNAGVWVSMTPYLNKNGGKRSWGPFRMCLLNSEANSAQSRCKLAGLSVLFTRHILNDPHELGTFFVETTKVKILNSQHNQNFFVHCSN